MSFCISHVPAFSQTAVASEEFPEIVGDLPPLPEDLAEFAAMEPAQYIRTEEVGSGRPDDSEMKRAYEILLNSPYGKPPHEVASYFLDLKGADAKFRREWPIRANPVIYHFFSATHTRPLGDVTPWCAAALNWFMLRAHATSKDQIGVAPAGFSKSGKAFTPEQLSKYSTRSASSGSFRCLKKTQQPEKGDILVLANKGTLGLSPKCIGSGHVAFFLKMDGDRAHVIGGNQSQRGSNGAITEAKFNIGPGSRFFSFVRPL